jgi:replicative DNA helicase Mcm
MTSDPHYITHLEEFLNAHYKRQLEKLAEVYPQSKSLDISYPILDGFDAELADELIEKPYSIIQATKDAVKAMDIVTGDGVDFLPNVRFHSLPDEQEVEIKNVRSDHINRFLKIPCTVTKITEVKPKLIEAAFECRHCGRVYNIPQEEQMGKILEPVMCSCERKNFELLIDQSSFVDTQVAAVQESLEKLRGGEAAKTLVVWLQDDITNKLLPGDKLEVTGTLRLKPPKYKNAVYDKFIDVNHVNKLEMEFEELELTDDDKRKIIELSRDPLIYDKIVASVAPSIYGYDEVKEAIALQLLSGTTNKVAPDGMKIRPDIHILLIGDPGTGKTRLLQYVNGLAPKGIYVSGKATTGAGLTATAEKDELAGGGWTLKAGALVLAAGGAAMIDEFDKMNDEDRSSMHEAMESQEIHVAKAGIITTFKANTSILAASNPKFGRFDRYTPIAQQFDIPPTILSRFDLIFPMKDEADEVKDRELADYVLTTHHVSGARAHLKSPDGKPRFDEEAALLKKEEKILPAIEPELLRKYISYARKEMHPVLSTEAMEKIQEFYLELRKIGEKNTTIPVTPRQLEAVVRLAEGSAKGRLSNVVELEDAERAIKLLKYYLKQILVDPSTGQIDIDLVYTGVPKSKMDKRKSVFYAIKRLNKEFDEVTSDAILEDVRAQGIKADDLKEILQILRREGDVYCPKEGIYKPAEEK